MDNSTEQRSPVMRFLDAFFQEDNIKWMLGAGVSILLGSSLRLVTMHWNECTPVWKYLILLGYTGIVFPLGEFTYHRLGLRKTGTFLMALTVLLIPLSFFALHWVRAHESISTIDLVLNTGLTTLLGINLVWSTIAAGRIFRHFLRRTQPTFLVCYLVLCVAGAIVPGLPVAWAAILALALWAVFAAGTIKVNRHVFWLTEESRLPRVFGFFPILLLGAQFFAIFVFGLASHLSIGWVGLLCTLIALPILLTADTVARVFEQRTGGLVRPIPWSISGPLMLGTTLCVAGVVMSLMGFPDSPMAVPSAVLAAIALGIIAHRTKQPACAWGMVICAIVAYQATPIFFKPMVMWIRDKAAEAINEQRLPYAFYGLTYAPLIAIFSLLAHRLNRQGQTLLSKPLRLTATVLPWILFGVSFTHPSAILLVALVLCPIFLGQVVLFQQRRLLVPFASAVLAAAYGIPGFCERVWDWHLSGDMALLVWTIAAGLLFVPGVIVDRWCLKFDKGETPVWWLFWSQNICQLFGLGATLFASGVWFERIVFHPLALQSDLAIPLSILFCTLLISHALRWINPQLSQWTLVFSTYIFLQHCMQGYWFLEPGLSTLAYLMLVQWLLSYWLECSPQSRFAKAFAGPLLTVSLCFLSVLFGLLLVALVLTHFYPITDQPWLTYVLVLAWALDAGRRLKSSLRTYIAWSSVFVFFSAAITAWFGPQVATPWWLTIWAAVGFACVGTKQALSSVLRLNDESLIDIPSDGWNSFRQGIQFSLSPLAVIVPVAFLSIAFGNLWFLDEPRRVAGLVAIGGIYACYRCRLRLNHISLFWPLLSWNILAFVTTVTVGRSIPIIDLTYADWRVCGLPLAATAAISIWIVELRYPRVWIQDPDVVFNHRRLMSVMTTTSLGAALFWRAGGHWEFNDIAYALTAWLSIIAAWIANSLRTQRTQCVWYAYTSLFVAIAYFVVAGLWELTSPASAYVCLLVGLGIWSIGFAAESSTRFSVLALPSKVTGFWLPLFVVPVAIWRQVHGDMSTWAGVNSLPLLGAAAFYFWRGLEQRQVPLVVLSAVILNIATALVWNELQWTDPQLFMIPIGISVLVITELMNREIPETYHERLRLVGSLMILVSPMFQIVTGSWSHILTLMIASLAVALVAIGLRVRILLYVGNAFLMADLAALVVRGSVDHPNLVWIVGVMIGASVITLGAFCENHRETLLGRLRGLAAELELWH